MRYKFVQGYYINAKKIKNTNNTAIVPNEFHTEQYAVTI
jgi:hypothetical protein